jgi:hypothetical protein
MNKPPKKSAPKPKRFKLPDGTGLVVWTDPIGTGSFAALVIKGGRLEVVDFDGSTMVYDFANAYDAIFPLLVAHTTMSEETAFHVLFCEMYNEKQARGVVQQILRLVGRERFEKQNFEVRYTGGRVRSLDLIDS